MDNPEIRKELLGRDSVWIAERIAKADNLNADLEEMLVELLDSHYGMATHHIGDGDGIPDEMAEKIKAYWADYLARN